MVVQSPAEKFNSHSLANRIYGHNGDAWAVPAGTEESIWAALGAGACGVLVNLFKTRDGQLVVAPSDNLSETCGVEKRIHDIDFVELQQLDAGYSFRSTQLDQNGQPTGVKGSDTPWRASNPQYPLKIRKALTFPLLRDLFAIFSRRTAFLIQLPDKTFPNIDDLINDLLELLNEFGLLARATIVASQDQAVAIRKVSKKCSLLLNTTDCELGEDIISKLKTLNCNYVFATIEQLDNLPSTEREQLLHKAKEADISCFFCSATMPWAPTAEVSTALGELNANIAGFITCGVLPTAEAFSPRAKIFSDTFEGKSLNLNYWRAGYSHINQETRVYVDDGFVIDISEGMLYSGGGTGLTLPVLGEFDVQVHFAVRNPHQATTFELAAIGIDPGYNQMDNSKLNSRNVNLTFDVHGAPPYASSERDQNDGFRCGWNNSSNITKFGGFDADGKADPEQQWDAASVNMYNKYGRDVGDAGPPVDGEDYATGWLRLVRCGQVFNSYYRDSHNAEWVCSGSMLVGAMPPEVFIRLAAKHWAKISPAPANKIIFKNFSLWQA